MSSNQQHPGPKSLDLPPPACRTAFDYAQRNEKLKGTDTLKQLEEASK
jgi:hypothetical protein